MENHLTAKMREAANPVLPTRCWTKMFDRLAEAFKNSYRYSTNWSRCIAYWVLYTPLERVV